MSTGLDYAAELISRARQARNLTLARMSEITGINPKTINRFELGQTTPKLATLTRLETFFGWEQGLLERIINSDTPWNVADIDELAGELPEAQLTDEALVWELTHRMQTKDEKIRELQDRVAELEMELQKLRKT
jgi:transcriptional regulator with XRE-family HTH domain